MKVTGMLTCTAVLFATLTGCPGGAAVHTDYDRNANFSQFKTFSFARVETDNPFYEQRVKDAVSKDLEAKGLRMVPSDGDLQLTAVGATTNQQEYQTFYNRPGFGYYYGGFGGLSTTTVRNYKVGALVLDMYNGQTKRLVWRGTASQGVSGSPDNNTSKLNSAVDKMLQKFPPA